MKRLRPLHPTHEDPMSVETWGGGRELAKETKERKKEEECPIWERRLYIRHAIPCQSPVKKGSKTLQLRCL